MHALGPHARLGELAPGREAQDVGAHLLGVGRREVLELDVRIETGPDHLELGHARQPRDHRPCEVDPLHAVQRCTAVGAEEHARAHLDVVAGDAERVEPPRDVEDPEHDQEHAEHTEQHDQHQPVAEHVVHGVLAGVVATWDHAVEEERDHPVAQVRDDDAHHDHEHEAAPEHGGQRMHPVPVAVAERRSRDSGRRMRSPGHGGGGRDLCHSPVRRVSATSIRVSRSTSAASCVSPGMTTPVEAAAVTSFSCAMPKPRSSGPWVMSTSCMRP